MHNLNHWMVWLWANAQYDRTTRSTLSRKKMHSLATGSASFRLILAVHLLFSINRLWCRIAG